MARLAHSLPPPGAASGHRLGRGAAPVLAGAGDRLRFFLRVLAPTWAKGVLLRRRGMVALADWLDLDRRAIRCMQALRRKYGEAPLVLATPWRPHLLILAPRDLERVLHDTPQPLTPASAAKRAALSHFEPHASLITRGEDRAPRRRFSDEVLESGRPVHDLAHSFFMIVRSEAALLLGALHEGDTLTWPRFTEAWFRAVRRIVLGEQARDDRALTQDLARLRAAANWSFLAPQRRELRARYYARLEAHLARAQPGSLAGMIARRPPAGGECAGDQVTQWLFAFDAGGMTVFRALALYLSHQGEMLRAAPDLAAWRAGKADLPQLRAGFLDTVRLWPTTPLILRETTEATRWDAAILPRGAGIVVYTPFFHRDDERLDCADRFAPDQWLGADPAGRPPLVPFSAGPAACPGRQVVTLLGAAWLAALLDSGRFALVRPKRLGPDRPLPATLNHFAIKLRVTH